uniref:Uncharacterized protein n=1 Tax=Romanomermis culicivorax TaxID=13658 RepID=A0A915L4D5_ROMCU
MCRIKLLGRTICIPQTSHDVWQENSSALPASPTNDDGSFSESVWSKLSDSQKPVITLLENKNLGIFPVGSHAEHMAERASSESVEFLAGNNNFKHKKSIENELHHRQFDRYTNNHCRPRPRHRRRQFVAVHSLFRPPNRYWPPSSIDEEPEQEVTSIDAIIIYRRRRRRKLRGRFLARPRGPSRSRFAARQHDALLLYVCVRLVVENIGTSPR